MLIFVNFLFFEFKSQTNKRKLIYRGDFERSQTTLKTFSEDLGHIYFRIGAI